MTVRVLASPLPFVTPDQILGDHASDDARIKLMIASVSGELDGPNGWLGRAIGPQLLEWSLDRWPNGAVELPYDPIIRVESVTYLDAFDREHVVPSESYYVRHATLKFRPDFPFPALGLSPDPVRIRYRAGFDGTELEKGGTGKIPEQIIEAVILMVQYLVALSAENLFLRSDTVEGVGTQQYTVSDQAGTIIRAAADRMLISVRRWVI